ncbi:MAG: hypothetical protein R3D69_10685 [Xanthobacteraceae bacterium]
MRSPSDFIALSPRSAFCAMSSSAVSKSAAAFSGDDNARCKLYAAATAPNICD